MNYNEFLFKKVRCKGFFKKNQDGKRVEISEDGLNCSYMVFDKVCEEIKCSCTGEKDFLKEYYIHKEKEFVGFVVSINKKLLVSSYLVANHDKSGEIDIHMEINERPTCAIVYFADNKKHYVPLEDIIEIVENKESLLKEEKDMYTNKFEKNVNKFDELKRVNFEYLELLPDEQIKHCIDEDKEYYESGWLITNKGRMWSLTDKRWLVPWNDNGYWRVANEYVHRWVCHYFPSEEDEHVLYVVEVHNVAYPEKPWSVEVHHKTTVEKIDSNTMTDSERILSCMEVNHKGNLVYQIKKDHDEAHRLMNGKKTKREEEGVEEFDDMMSIMRNSNPEVYYSYDEKGNKVVNMKVQLKGMTLEEEKIYEEEFEKSHGSSKEIYYFSV